MKPAAPMAASTDPERPRQDPEPVAQPSVWPPLLAFGATLGVWGLISSYLVTVVGVLCFGIALIGWISAIRHERRQQ